MIPTYSEIRRCMETALREALDTMGVDPYTVDRMAWEGAVADLTEAAEELTVQKSRAA